ncbi:MAG: hypothetical protein LBS71_01380, partial [Puniceicoccales bacterium]|nr:hypothetical protein [Puniceicoccales bacterium]
MSSLRPFQNLPSSPLPGAQDVGTLRGANQTPGSPPVKQNQMNRGVAQGSAQASNVGAQVSLSGRAITLSKKNFIASWFSKRNTISKLRQYKQPTSEERINILKKQLDKGHLDFSRIKELRQEGKINDFEVHYLVQRELFEKGEIGGLTFAKSVICVFKDQATERRGLVDILREQCNFDSKSDDFKNLLSDFMQDQSLKGVTLLANKDELAAYKLELAKSLIPVFKDRATEEKPLMDILC